MDAAVARKLTDELPTPLAELVARALAARKGRDRHDAVFYLGEATLKLAASLRIGRWLDAALTPGSDLAKRLESVVFPSLGHWCAFFREAGGALAAKDDPLFARAAMKELEKTPPSGAALGAFADALVRWDVGDAETVKRLRRRGVLGFFEALVMYRNAVLGHGAQRSPAFYEEAAAILFDALAEVLRSPGLFGGLVLAVAELDVDARGKGARATWRELRGMVPVPLGDDAKDARPGELYFRGERGAVSVHPFVILLHEDEAVRFAFLNRAVEKKEQIQRADYLDYRTSNVVDDVDAVVALSGVLTRLRGKPASADAVKELAQTIGPAAVATEARTDWIGRVVADKYRITGTLGEGGMGTVYAADHVELPRSYAVKTILPHLARNEELVERFRREAFAAAKLRHRGIVDVVDFGRADDGTVYMVMERLEGRSLDEVSELPVDRVIAIAKEVLDALAVAHEAGLVHRDLKPANLFETADGGVKVLDFGIAKMTSAGDEPELTSAGAVLGTPLYMAPEQVTSSAGVDARADLYSLGATLYRLLTGTTPAATASMHLVVAKVAAGDIERDARKKRPDVPATLARTIARALAKAPADRFASAKEMRAALDHADDAAATKETRALGEDDARATKETRALGHEDETADVELPGPVTRGATERAPNDSAPPGPVTRGASERAPGESATGEPVRRIALVVVALLVPVLGFMLLRKHATDPAPPPIPGPPPPAPAPVDASVDAAPPLETGPLSAEAIHKRYAASVVYLDLVDGKGEPSAGTGFVVDRHGLIATPSHVVDPKTKVKVLFKNGAEVDKTSMVLFAEDKTLTLLRADVAHPSAGTVPELTPLPIASSDDLELGARLVSLGYPGTKELALREGVMSSKRPLPKYDWFGATLPIQMGEGGAPVLDADGRVVGMVAAMTKTEALVLPASAFRGAVTREAAR
ncbi:MAG: protein kinase [Labilithrix sp.]|nr:protein kinase [Labilithrix sp.]MCW5811982.1 protein kinase [Labilithrix sp.]